MAMLLLLAADNALLVIAAMCLAGIADGPQLAAIFTVRNREAPEHSRSQVFTTGASLKFTGAAIGAAIAGYIAAHFSLDWTIFAAALVQALAALTYLVLSRSSRITS